MSRSIKTHYAPRGSIALLTAIITSAIVSVFVLTSGYAVFLARRDELHTTNKLRAKSLAISCAYEALYLYTENPRDLDIVVPITIYQDSHVKEICTIDSIHTENNLLHIRTYASIQNAYTYLNALADLATTSKEIILSFSWNESTSTPP